MVNGPLTPQQIDQFIELGFCALPAAFTAQQAAAATACVWRRMEEKAGIRRTDPSTWPPCYDIEEHLDDREVLACFTDRLADGIEQLVGRGRWQGARRWGLWPVNFSFGADHAYDYPTSGWHIDGNWFRHTLDCPKQGLLVIGLFTDVGPREGGTILALGSHKRTAHVLARHRQGISHLDLFQEVLSEPLSEFHEVNGAAGDVVLAHPFLFHTRGFKHGGSPRIISNTEAGLHESMKLHRAQNEDYSILEESIYKALQKAPVASPRGRICRF